MSIANVIEASTGVVIGKQDAEQAHGWFATLVRHFVRHYRSRHPPGGVATNASDQNLDARARRLVARTSLLSAATGAASGAASTGAELIAAQWGGLSIPFAMLGVGGEAVLRIKLHVELTCALADMFQVRLDIDEPSDLWRLYALTFNTRGQDRSADEPGRGLVGDLTQSEDSDLAGELGLKILRETLLRNLVPGVAIASSAYTNYRLTHSLGDNVRRYMRYQRALQDAFTLDTAALSTERALLIEGIWFVFSADGTLNPEEAALLASLVDDLPASDREAVVCRFTLDEQDWLERIGSQVGAAHREAFQRALEVAAAVDKQVGLPEQKVLGRAAHALGQPFDLTRVQSMIRSFEADGVLPEA